jgi:sulfite reductase (NADPH) hemoprotein beta-component
MRPVTSAGWNVTVGGGMGMTHGEPDTYPRTAEVIGMCASADAVALAEAVVTVQRDWGDGANRKHARLKYTIEDRGLDYFRAEVFDRHSRRQFDVGAAQSSPRPAIATAGTTASTTAVT